MPSCFDTDALVSASSASSASYAAGSATIFAAASFS